MAGSGDSKAPDVDTIARLRANRIGQVVHYFPKARAAAVEITAGVLSLGDIIEVRGHTTDFTHTIESMRLDDADVVHARAGQTVGIRLPGPARKGDAVFRLTE